MAVTEGEFDAMVDDLTAALDEHKVAKDDQRKVLAFFASLRDQVVEPGGPADAPAKECFTPPGGEAHYRHFTTEANGPSDRVVPDARRAHTENRSRCRQRDRQRRVA